MPTFRKTVRAAVAAAALLSASLFASALSSQTAAAQTAGGEKEIRFSHHFPENPDDWRHAYALAFADAVAKANVGLKVTIFPDQRLMRAKEQWGALGKGTIDVSMFSLAELAEGVPEVQALGLPAIIKDVNHAARLAASPFMERLRGLVDAQGVVVPEGGVWLPGGVGSAKECITTPADLVGMAVRTSSKALEFLFEGAGALTMALPSSELQKGLKTGALDGVTFPVASFVSSNIRSEIKCLVIPGDGTLFFTYAPIVVSKTGLAALTDAQRDAIRAAARSSAAVIQERIAKMDADAEGIFTKAGVQVRRLDAASFAAWRADAERTSFAAFAKSSPTAPEVLDLMKSVP